MAENSLALDTSGDGHAIQYEPCTVVRDYRIQWEKERLNLSELAKLRWVRRWPIAKIAEHLNLTLDQVKGVKFAIYLALVGELKVFTLVMVNKPANVQKQNRKLVY